ncbi:DUF2069 domain-containing protein [Lysobacter sp. HDW10]|uniref:DUF2069 domain-containing protein n=1 Tax=Lysobacter sp. HDW10 TaxID=2714936 RepID=UPI00140D56D4|nr:DUF2069 domain-containing protein [Lysobacter sp. HDW10]QIK81220.1 DUF2069 domain-containing protein [Lysobacter sp. HDW10]
MSKSRAVLMLALCALIALYVFWFKEKTVALAVFAVPVVLLLLGVSLKRRTAGFWSALFALLWFSHGVMVAWTRAPERAYAWAEIVLAVVIVFAASIPGMQSRFAKRTDTPSL